MNWRPVSYPKLSVDAIATINALLSRDRPVEMANGGTRYSIRPLAVRERCDTCISLRIEVGGAAIDVHLSPATLEAVLTDLLSRQAFEVLDKDLQFAVLETALREPLDTLTRHLQTPVTLTAITGIGEIDPAAEESSRPVGEPGSMPSSLRFEIHRQSDASLFVVQADLNAGLPESAQQVLNDNSVRRRRDFSALPAPVVFELGRAVLPASDAQGLEPGDIVLFDESYIDGGTLRISVADRMIHQGEVNGLELTVMATPVNAAPAQ